MESRQQPVGHWIWCWPRGSGVPSYSSWKRLPGRSQCMADLCSGTIWAWQAPRSVVMPLPALQSLQDHLSSSAQSALSWEIPQVVSTEAKENRYHTVHSFLWQVLQQVTITYSARIIVFLDQFSYCPVILLWLTVNGCLLCNLMSANITNKAFKQKQQKRKILNWRTMLTQCLSSHHCHHIVWPRLGWD